MKNHGLIRGIHSTRTGKNFFTHEANGGGGSSTTVNATTAGIDVTALTASVSAAVSITASVAAIDISTYQASVSLGGGGTTVNATTAGIDVTPYAATINGTITTEELANNSGTILSSQSGIEANVYSISDGSHILRKTGLTSDGSGVVTFTDAALIPGTTYRVVITISTSDGVARIAAA